MSRSSMGEQSAENDVPCSRLTESEINELYRRWQQKVNFTYMLDAVERILADHTCPIPPGSSDTGDSTC